MANVGTLTVELQASIAEFQKDLGRAAALAEQQSRRINAAFATVSRSLGAIGVGVSIAGIVEFARETVKAAEDLNNLSADTGSSVEELSRLSNIAKVSGKDFGDFQTILLRVAAGLNGSEDGSTKTGQALKFLGVTARDPAAALQEVATKLATFADGAGKAAVARDLFGKGGPAFLSTLKSIADAQDIASTTTAKQAQESQKLAEDIRQLGVQSTALKDIILSAVVPALDEMVTEFVQARKEGGGLYETLKLFASINPFTSLADNLKTNAKQIDDIQSSIAGVKASAGGFLAKISPSSQDTSALDAKLSELKQIRDVLKKSQIATLGNLNDPTNFDARDIRARQKPTLDYKSATGGAVDDPTKKILEGQIKALNADIEEEKSLLATRNEVLSKYYEQGYISLTEFFDKQDELRKDNLARTVADYQAELAANDAYINARDKAGAPAHSEKDIQDVRNKSIDITKKLQLAEQEYGKQSVVSSLDRIKAEHDYGDALKQIDAQILELQGHSAEAAKLQNALSAANDSRKFAGDPAAQAAITNRQQLLDLQAEINASQTKFGQITQGVGIIDATIDLKQQQGFLTEIDAINEKTRLHQQYIPVLEKEAAEYEALAAKSSDPRFALAAAQLRLQIAQVGAQSDQLSAKFRTDFEGSFATLLGDIESHKKSVKESLNDFATSLNTSISQTANKQISEMLFGKDGPLGGISDFIAGLFGAPPSSSSAAGGVGGASATAAPQVLSLGAAAAQAALALQAIGGGSGGAGISGIPGIEDFNSFLDSAGTDGSGVLYDLTGGLSGIPGFANGTNFAPGGFAKVGENGPELVHLPRGAQVIPNAALNQARGAKSGDTHYNNYTIHVNVPVNTSRSTAEQTGASVARELQRARARNG